MNIKKTADLLINFAIKRLAEILGLTIFIAGIILLFKLHHKYLSQLMDLKAKKIAYTHKLEEIKKDKELYYSGQATSDEYKEKPFDLKLKTKAGIDKHVNTDPAVVQIEQKIEYINILLEGLNHILEQVKWRNQSIKNAIDWIRFTSGSL